MSSSYLQFRLLESLGIWLPGRTFVEGFTFPLQAVDSDLHCQVLLSPPSSALIVGCSSTVLEQADSA